MIGTISRQSCHIISVTIHIFSKMKRKKSINSRVLPSDILYQMNLLIWFSFYGYCAMCKTCMQCVRNTCDQRELINVSIMVGNWNITAEIDWQISITSKTRTVLYLCYFLKIFTFVILKFLRKFHLILITSKCLAWTIQA